MRVTKLFGLPLVLSACAHSGVVSIGPDTYMIANSEWGFSSGSYQKAKALKEASDYCRGIDKESLPISTKQNDVEFGKTPAAEVQFRCLTPKDPELKPRRPPKLPHFWPPQTPPPELIGVRGSTLA